MKEFLIVGKDEAMFSNSFSVSLRNKVITIWKRLRESIRGNFMELENLIRQDPDKTTIPYGSLHLITRYVMNYGNKSSCWKIGNWFR